MATGSFCSGISGLALPVRNKLQYPAEYQDKSRLCYYSSLFNSVEINSSFYKIPQAKTIRRWADDVADNFLFTFKLWRNITHNKSLTFDTEDVKRFMNVINEVDYKKGSLLVQFPATTTNINLRQLDILLNDIKHCDTDSKWNIAVEFRHRSWYNEEVYELLCKYRTVIVMHDMPNSTTPMIASATNSVYLRFHGPNGDYRGSYEDAFLYEYAQYIKEWVREGKDVYAYFNNTMGDAVKNLITLNKFVNATD